jgi:hypothetical protein
VRPRLLDLFEERVVRSDGCWLWRGAHNDCGYGQLWHGYRLMVYAHRFAYETFVGPIPDTYVIDHLCENPGCCNPGHLEAVPHQVNIKRGRSGTKTACKYGHDWADPRNVYYRRDGRRWCAACQRERWSSAARKARSAA